MDWNFKNFVIGFFNTLKGFFLYFLNKVNELIFNILHERKRRQKNKSICEHFWDEDLLVLLLKVTISFLFIKISHKNRKGIEFFHMVFTSKIINGPNPSPSSTFTGYSALIFLFPDNASGNFLQKVRKNQSSFCQHPPHALQP